MPSIPVATHHNRFFSEPPTFDGTQQTTFSHVKKLCISQVSVVTFSGVVAKWVTVCFLLG